jgi:integrase
LDKPCAIYATIEVDGRKSCPFSTKLKVPQKYWNTPGNKKIQPSSKEYLVSETFLFAKKVNDQLNYIRKYSDEARNILEHLEQAVTPEAIKDLITKPKAPVVVKKYIDVLDELRVTLTTKKRKKSTMDNYRTRRNNINEFLTAKGFEKLTVGEFRFRHFEECQLWMFDQMSDEGGPRWNKNTINKHLTLVNQVLNYAINKGYIKSNPIGQMGLEYDPTKPPQYLVSDDRKRIFDCSMKSLEKERDISVFLMYTGLSHTDYMSLKDKHLFRLPTGEWFIKKERDKSEIYSIIPLLTQAHEIVKKYGSVSRLPRLHLSDFNKALKILGEISQAPFPLSTSVFRETFSSMMENEFMVPDRVIMFMVGHTNPKQLRNYSSVHPARVLHELKKNDVDIPFNLEIYKELVKAS